MSLVESAQDIFDKGTSAAKDVVSAAAIEQQAYMKSFVRLCSDGWNQGWHERNGGNLSYRMTDAEVAASKRFFFDTPGAWSFMGVKADNLCGAYFVVTGAGCYLKNLANDLPHNAGIVEINETGDAWRIVWGLLDGGRPSSEFPSHFMNHSVRMRATGDACRVIYHAHTPQVIALSTVVPPDTRAYTRLLWKSMTECVIVFPDGVGVVPWMVPGGSEIAQASCKLMEKHAAVIWCQHGMFCSGASFDEAFGLMHTIEKSAALYLMARAAMGGAEPPCLISDDELRAVCRAFNVPVNEEFLDV